MASEKDIARLERAVANAATAAHGTCALTTGHDFDPPPSAFPIKNYTGNVYTRCKRCHYYVSAEYVDGVVIDTSTKMDALKEAKDHLKEACAANGHVGVDGTNAVVWGFRAQPTADVYACTRCFTTIREEPRTPPATPST